MNSATVADVSSRRHAMAVSRIAGRRAKRSIGHPALIDLAGGPGNERNARAGRYHPQDHVQMIDLVRRMRDEASLAAGPEHRRMKHGHGVARRQDEGFVRKARQLEV
jgi:hypothetical protein